MRTRKPGQRDFVEAVRAAYGLYLMPVRTHTQEMDYAKSVVAMSNIYDHAPAVLDGRHVVHNLSRSALEWATQILRREDDGAE